MKSYGIIQHSNITWLDFQEYLFLLKLIQWVAICLVSSSKLSSINPTTLFRWPFVARWCLDNNSILIVIEGLSPELLSPKRSCFHYPVSLTSKFLVYICSLWLFSEHWQIIVTNLTSSLFCLAFLSLWHPYLLAVTLSIITIHNYKLLPLFFHFSHYLTITCIR